MPVSGSSPAWLRGLLRAERGALGALFLCMVALFFVGVLAREFGGTHASHFAWIEEAVRLMNLFLVFGALGLALQRGRHVGVDTFRRRLSPHWQRAAIKLVDASGLAFCSVLVWLGAGFVQFVLGTGQRSPSLGIPMGWIYLAPVIGFALLGLRYALSLLGLIDRGIAREPIVAAGPPGPQEPPGPAP